MIAAGKPADAGAIPAADASRTPPAGAARPRGRAARRMRRPAPRAGLRAARGQVQARAPRRQADAGRLPGAAAAGTPAVDAAAAGAAREAARRAVEPAHRAPVAREVRAEGSGGQVCHPLLREDGFEAVLTGKLRDSRAAETFAALMLSICCTSSTGSVRLQHEIMEIKRIFSRSIKS